MIADKSTSQGQKLKLLINAVSLCFVMYCASQEPFPVKQVSLFEELMIDILSPVQRFVSNSRRNISTYMDNYLLNVNAKKEAERLKFQLSEMESQVFELEQKLNDSRRQNKLVKGYQSYPGNKVLAKVVAWDSVGSHRMIRINKGINDGVSLQSAVITHQGLVGYIYRITNNFSDVLTILDSNNKVDSIIERTRSHGIVEGTLDDYCTMKYIKRRDPIVLDDLVLTSGLGNIYPKGLRVGRVVQIERQSYGISQKITVKPAVNFSKLEDVIILSSENTLKVQAEWDELDRQ